MSLNCLDQVQPSSFWSPAPSRAEFGTIRHYSTADGPDLSFWNSRNRLFLLLSSLCCLLRIWPFERSVSWCILEQCRWAGFRAKSSNTSQPWSYVKEQCLFCLWLTCCHPSMAFCVAPSLISVKAFCWDPRAHVWFQLLVFSSCWNPCATFPHFIQVFI